VNYAAYCTAALQYSHGSGIGIGIQLRAYYMEFTVKIKKIAQRSVDKRLRFGRVGRVFVGLSTRPRGRKKKL
jgi:hypothetical protein